MKGDLIVKGQNQERCLWLSKDEAMGLLNLVLNSPEDMSKEQHLVMEKLGEMCRQFIHDEREQEAASDNVILMKLAA